MVDDPNDYTEFTFIGTGIDIKIPLWSSKEFEVNDYAYYNNKTLITILGEKRKYISFYPSVRILEALNLETGEIFELDEYVPMVKVPKNSKLETVKALYGTKE